MREVRGGQRRGGHLETEELDLFLVDLFIIQTGYDDYKDVWLHIVNASNFKIV